ncbi:hypothetical protein [Pinibacter aurantiacus]|uniref:Lipoprotein n=1 Tax=Pinibacter aurantiacus TaxID=2851599 RepID=A0A9E2S816_9BACT|nr:hypothetical protein [Pinibacter aurantiacus]MBV4357966.1 hypothetical protein [Pinibacter aurantiacus]
MKYLQYSIFLILLAACNNNQTTKTGANQGTAIDTANPNVDFFPVADYIKSQVHMVDSMQLPIMKTSIVGKDSVPSSIKQEEFSKIAAEFYTPDISDAGIKKDYKETAFADQSIPSVTFTYTTKNPSLEIQRLDVLIKPDPVQSDKVRTIYLEKFFEKGDTSFSQKLFWRADKNCQIITTTQPKNGVEVTKIVKVSWSGE